MERLSIRQMTALAVAVFASIAGVVIGTLIWTSTLFHHSVATVIRDTKSQAIVNELEVALLMSQRLSNLFIVTGEPELGRAKDELRASFGALLSGASNHIGSTEEEHLLASIERRLESYLESRAGHETRGLDLKQIVGATQPALNAIIDDLERLRRINELQVRVAEGEARRLNHTSNLAGASAGGILLIGLLLVSIGVRRYLLNPAYRLHQGISRFESGETGVRVRSTGLRELRELAEGFNGMAAAVARQRESQLTFVAGVAHDLRSPLQGLKLGIHCLDDETSEARRLRTRERLDRQVDRMSRMIDDLLDATRIEAGQLDLRVQELDVRTIVDDVVALYGPTSPDHHLVKALPRDPVMIAGDPLRIEQVVSNLLSNAIKFSPRGGVIELSADTSVEGQRISVRDHGIGIAKEELGNIFLPFRRAKPDVAPGAGLGLSVVRRILTAHGGRIEEQSEPGAGSTFVVTLPCPEVRIQEPLALQVR